MERIVLETITHNDKKSNAHQEPPENRYRDAVARGDTAAQRRLTAEVVARYTSIVEQAVRRHKAWSPEKQHEARNEGVLAMLEALQKFDPARGSFSAFVFLPVKKAIDDFAARETGVKSTHRRADDSRSERNDLRRPVEYSEDAHGVGPFGGAYAEPSDPESLAIAAETRRAAVAFLETTTPEDLRALGLAPGRPRIDAHGRYISVRERFLAFSKGGDR